MPLARVEAGLPGLMESVRRWLLMVARGLHSFSEYSLRAGAVVWNDGVDVGTGGTMSPATGCFGLLSALDLFDRYQIRWLGSLMF